MSNNKIFINKQCQSTLRLSGRQPSHPSQFKSFLITTTEIFNSNICNMEDD